MVGGRNGPGAPPRRGGAAGWCPPEGPGPRSPTSGVRSRPPVCHAGRRRRGSHGPRCCAGRRFPRRDRAFDPLRPTDRVDERPGLRRGGARPSPPAPRDRPGAASAFARRAALHPRREEPDDPAVRPRRLRSARPRCRLERVADGRRSVPLHGRRLRVARRGIPARATRLLRTGRGADPPNRLAQRHDGSAPRGRVRPPGSRPKCDELDGAVTRRRTRRTAAGRYPLASRTRFHGPNETLGTRSAHYRCRRGVWSSGSPAHDRNTSSIAATPSGPSYPRRPPAALLRVATERGSARWCSRRGGPAPGAALRAGSKFVTGALCLPVAAGDELEDPETGCPLAGRMSPSRERAPKEGSDEGDDGRRPGRRGAATAASGAGGEARRVGGRRGAVLHAETGTAPGPFAAAKEAAVRSGAGARPGGAAGMRGSSRAPRDDRVADRMSWRRIRRPDAPPGSTPPIAVGAPGQHASARRKGDGAGDAHHRSRRGRGRRQARPVGRPMVEEAKRSCRRGGRIRPAGRRDGGALDARRLTVSASSRPRRRIDRLPAAGSVPEGTSRSRPAARPSRPALPIPGARSGSGDQPASGAGSRV